MGAGGSNTSRGNRITSPENKALNPIYRSNQLRLIYNRLYNLQCIIIY
jgi:hypothetical protein